jgi:excisionase family DNA binding protein
LSSRLLNIDELARFLGVSRKTIYYWVGRAEIPFVRVGRHLRFEPGPVLRHFALKTEGEDSAIACAKYRADLLSRTEVWSLKTGAGLAGS